MNLVKEWKDNDYLILLKSMISSGKTSLMVSLAAFVETIRLEHELRNEKLEKETNN